VKDLKAIRFVEGSKISHDYKGNQVETFSYRDLVMKSVPAIGIPCKQNGLIVVDVDVADGINHLKDGREWWAKFAAENGVPNTYMVKSRSGGFHFYFKLPAAVNPDTFAPPAQLADGVDLKWNGWVGAPPSRGYSVLSGTIADIIEAPPSLMAEISRCIKGGAVKEYEFTGNYNNVLEIHRPYSEEQIRDLRNRIESAQSVASLSYSEWRDGLFSLKAGIQDPAILEDLALKWTYNKSYSPGDEFKAREIVARATAHGGVGPGTIFSILGNVALREGTPIINSPFTSQEIFDRSKCTLKINQNGGVKIHPSESNAASIIGAMYEPSDLYHDIRQDLYILKGKAISDVELLNTITPQLQSISGGLGLENFKMGTISGGLDVLLTMRQIDPHLTWLEELKWDGKSRIDTFFPVYVGVDDTDYTRAVSKNFWISMAARGLQPGIKFDSMVVLEGHEGIRKSSLVQAIGGEYTFTPSTTKVMEDLDDLRKMHQSIIVELPELMGLVGQDANKVKAFLSKPFDHIRGLYSKKAMKRLRGFVFMGTTNSSKYLAADMGVRRFWPLKIPSSVKSIDLWSINADREQLFAEAVVRFKKGENFYEVPMDDLTATVRTRAVTEPLMAPIRDFVPMLGPTFRLTEIYQRLEISSFVPRGFNMQVARRIENALKFLGYQEFHVEEGAVWGKSIPQEVQATLSNFI
jgi:hypothetical protein